MRDLKFRARISIPGKWAGKWIYYGTARTEPADHYGLDEKTEGQYTGLKDSTQWKDLTEDERAEWVRDGHMPSEWDGRRIYEGDIVRWQSSYVGASQDFHTDVMAWDEGGACFMLVPWIHEPSAASMEVIGNIHENPELLE